MSTKRIPVNRPQVVQITPRAIDLYEDMARLRCSCPSPKPPTQGPCPGCERWYDLHEELHRELGCKLWEWPAVARQSPSRAGSPYRNDEIAARMALLDEAVRQRRTAPSSLEEGDPNAEPVAGQEVS
jgi:hypothetical protein